jgi:hypothetical protein
MPNAMKRIGSRRQGDDLIEEEHEAQEEDAGVRKRPMCRPSRTAGRSSARLRRNRRDVARVSFHMLWDRRS